MAELNKKQVDIIMASLTELDEFKDKIRSTLKSKKFSQFNLDEVEANLRYIESNIEYVIDLLTSKN